MGIPTNFKTLLSGNVVEWARIEFKETWDAEASLKTICAIVALLMVITAGAIGLILEKQPTGYDMEYPIVNQHVNWSGAGYSGIYATGD